MAQAADFFCMTPREIHGAVTAFGKRQAQRQREIVLLARYIALSVHAPALLPSLPQDPLPPMTDEQIKQRLLSWRRKESV